jgi:hypothetical protein
VTQTRRHGWTITEHVAHEQAVAAAEARRVRRALAPFGILSREALERQCGAAHWHAGGFDRAIAAAIASGMVEALPGGFYRDTRCGS